MKGTVSNGPQGSLVPPSQIISETIYVEGFSPTGRAWQEVVAALRSSARRVGATVRILAQGPEGALLSMRATIKTMVSWNEWAPTEDLLYDPRCLASTLRAMPAYRETPLGLLAEALRGMSQQPAARAARRKTA